MSRPAPFPPEDVALSTHRAPLSIRSLRTPKSNCQRPRTQSWRAAPSVMVTPIKELLFLTLRIDSASSATLPKRRGNWQAWNCASCSAARLRTIGGPSRRWDQESTKFGFDCADGWFRAMYVAKLPEAIYVLHSFQKSSRKTSKGDVAIAEARYRAVGRERMGPR
jgi:hypothetical protein